MLWLRDLRFVMCSRDLDVLSAQRITTSGAFFYLYYPQINEVEKSDQMVRTIKASKKFWEGRTSYSTEIFSVKGKQLLTKSEFPLRKERKKERKK